MLIEYKTFKVREGSNKIILYNPQNENVGYIKYQYPLDPSGQRNIEIAYLFIKPKFRRKGYATVLLEYFLDKFKDKTYISLYTSKGIEQTKGFTIYEKLGFKQICCLDDYYAPRIPIRLFVKFNNPS